MYTNSIVKNNPEMNTYRNHLLCQFNTDFMQGYSGDIRQDNIRENISYIDDLYDAVAYIMGINTNLPEPVYTEEQQRVFIQHILDNETGIPCTSSELFHNNDMGQVQEFFKTEEKLDNFLASTKPFKGLTIG